MSGAERLLRAERRPRGEARAVLEAALAAEPRHPLDRTREAPIQCLLEDL